MKGFGDEGESVADYASPSIWLRLLTLSVRNASDESSPRRAFGIQVSARREPGTSGVELS